MRPVGSALDALVLERSDKTLRHSIFMEITTQAYRVFHLSNLYEDTLSNSYGKHFLLIICNRPIDGGFVHAKAGCNF